MIFNLQLLRAFAAINVVAFHIIATGAAYGYGPTYIGSLGGWGANGVDIFFVISGFVMFYTQYHNQRSAIDFLKSRLVRIVPIYWFITFVALGAMYLLPSAAFNSGAPGPKEIFESLFFMSGLLSGTSPIIYLGWTLEWEMFFYFIFFISIYFNSRRAGNIFIFIMLLIAAYIAGNLIVIEFFLGMIIAHLYVNFNISQKLGLIILFFGMGLLLMTIAFEIPDNYRFIFWGIPAAIIIYGSVYSHQYDNIVIKYLGDASYSIYLIQMLTIPVFYKIVQKFGIVIFNDVLALLCLLLSVMAGLLMYLFIEKPLTAFVRKKTQ